MINPQTIIQMLQSARNPEQFVNNMLNANPQMRTAIEQMRNSTNGASYEDIAKQLAKQRGMSDEELQRLYAQITHRNM